jgi:hypothetical protein
LAIFGTVDEDELCELHVYVDGEELEDVKVTNGKWEVHVKIKEAQRSRPEEISLPDISKAMVLALVKGKNGRSSASMIFI